MYLIGQSCFSVSHSFLSNLLTTFNVSEKCSQYSGVRVNFLYDVTGTFYLFLVRSNIKIHIGRTKLFENKNLFLRSTVNVNQTDFHFSQFKYIS
jgi:hypothetical protein